jgi:hypothetical protein
MQIDMAIKEYEEGDRYFTFEIDRRLQYDFEEEEIARICYLYLKNQIERLETWLHEDENNGATEDAESTAKALNATITAVNFMTEYGVLNKLFDKPLGAKDE